jgi:peptidoglycan/LPS O-acetylase OafA/YrhL
LFPALIALLVVVAIACAFFYQDAARKTASDIVASAFYVNNWWYIVADQSYFDFIARPPLLKHLWSLAIEEQFYFVWPLVAYLLMRAWRRRGVLIASTALALASTGWMFYLAVQRGYPELADPSRVYFGTDSHAMGLLVGAALASVWRPGRVNASINRTTKDLLTASGVLALLGLLAFYIYVGEFTPWLYRGGFLLLALVVAGLIVAATHPGTIFGKILGTQPWRYIGQRSYGLYLWHWPIFAVTRPEIDTPLEGLPLLALRLILTFAIAELSYRYLEMPIRRGAIGRLTKQLKSTDPTRTLVHRKVWIQSIAVGSLAVIAFTWISVSLISSAQNSKPAADVVAAVGTEKRVRIDGLVRPAVTGIGDSVMLGARSTLKKFLPGLAVDAAVSRFPGGFLGPMRRYETKGTLSPVVVIHPGTNGTLTESMMRAILNIVATHPRVVVVNNNMPRSWRDSNNEAIWNVVPEYPNAVIANWRGASKDHPEYFVSDRIHLTKKGAQAYAALIKQAINDTN